MIRGFKEFLFKNNVLALAVAVIVGGAVGKVVSSLAADIIMPLVSFVLPSGEWRSAKFILRESVGPDGKPIVNAVTYGTFFWQRGRLCDHRVCCLHDHQGTYQGAAGCPTATFEDLSAVQGNRSGGCIPVQVLHFRDLRK